MVLYRTYINISISPTLSLPQLIVELNYQGANSKYSTRRLAATESQLGSGDTSWKVGRVAQVGTMFLTGGRAGVQGFKFNKMTVVSTKQTGGTAVIIWAREGFVVVQEVCM